MSSGHSLLPVMFLRLGAEKIIPVEHVEEAFSLKKMMPDAVMLGERFERKVPALILATLLLTF